MYYTDEDIQTYYKTLQLEAKMKNEEIIALQLDEMRMLAEKLNSELNKRPCEVYQFKESQRSRPYLYLIEEEFKSLMNKLNELTTIQDQPQHSEKHRQSMELSSKLFEFAWKAICSAPRKNPKYKHIRINRFTFTFTFLKSAKEKSKNVHKPKPVVNVLPIEPPMHVTIEKEEKKNEQDGINLETEEETKINESLALNANLQSDKKTTSHFDSYTLAYLAKLFPTFVPPPSSPLINNTFPNSSCLLSSQITQKRKFSQINNNNVEDGSFKIKCADDISTESDDFDDKNSSKYDSSSEYGYSS